MKKTLFIFFAFLIFFSFGNVNAYNTSTYSIDIPSSFVKESNKSIWQRNNKDEIISLIINVDENKSKLNFEDYSEEDLKKDKYINEIKEKINDIKNGISLKSSDLYFVNINDLKAIKMDITSSYTESNKYNSLVYQTQYIVASKNYVYYIVLSSSKKELLLSSEINNMINSFNVNDIKAKKDDSMTKYYLSIGIVVALAFLTFVLYNRKK